MSQRTALLLAAGLTAFVLVIAGGVIARTAQTPPTFAAGSAVEPGAEAAADPTMQALLQDRENARRAIEQANERIRQASQQQSALQQANEQLRLAVDQPAPGGDRRRLREGKHHDDDDDD